MDNVSTPARLAGAVLSSEEPHSDALADAPARDAWPHRFNAANHLMTWHARKRQSRKDAFNRCCIRVAYPARIHTDPNLTDTGLSNRSVDDVERTRRRNLNCLV